MGGLVKDSTTTDILAQLNKRFDAEGLPEMVALQKEFKVFSAKHSLQQSFALLGITPADAAERRNWYRFLDVLNKYKSDLPNVTGHDRWIKAIQSNLESKTPLPLAIACHAAADDPKLKVSQGKPHVFSSDDHVIVSVPTTPKGQARPRAAKSEK
jgi:hypothetical protein